MLAREMADSHVAAMALRVLTPSRGAGMGEHPMRE
jgi:hypothetical protein